MVDANYLGIAVRSIYKAVMTSKRSIPFDTLYASDRLKLSLEGYC
jgi:hypothetical protein